GPIESPSAFLKAPAGRRWPEPAVLVIHGYSAAARRSQVRPPPSPEAASDPQRRLDRWRSASACGGLCPAASGAASLVSGFLGSTSPRPRSVTTGPPIVTGRRDRQPSCTAE